MPELTRREILAMLLTAPAATSCWAQEPSDTSAWTPLFDGKTLNGWKPSEHQGSFKVVDGQIVAHGDRSHLFYNGPVNSADFRNFELALEIKTMPGSNSGVYFHTAFQPSGFPSAGFEVQVENNDPAPATGYVERKKTGSLYGIRNVYKTFAKNGEWFKLSILVRGKRVQTRINDTLVVDYVEPDQPFQADPSSTRPQSRNFRSPGSRSGQHHPLHQHSRSPAARYGRAPLQQSTPQSTISIARSFVSAQRTIPWSTTTCISKAA